MKEDQDDFTSPTGPSPRGFETNPFDKKERNKTYFQDFDADLDEDSAEIYEEPDRDTDFAPGFREETVDEEDAFEQLLPSEFEPADDALFAEQEQFLRSETATVKKKHFPEDADEPWAVDEASPWQTAGQDPEESDDPDIPWETAPLPDEDETWHERQGSKDSWLSAAAADTHEDGPDWAEDEDEYFEDEIGNERWPIGLMAVGALALLLVIAGVYGIVQQRSATQEQIRQLQASLATRVSPAELEDTRLALQESKELGTALSAEVARLTQQNQRLNDTVAGLEAQLAAAQQVAEDGAATPAKPAADPVKAPPPEPAPARAAAPVAASAAAASGWFVNFGSYGDESLAKDWAARLKPASGNVIVAAASADGRTYYRVRVVDLPSRDAAERVADQLEKSHDLSKLWVGRLQ